jgi:uncharacterized protein (TIGR02996 family)
MDSEQVLLDILHDDPCDETAWLALADCLDERGQVHRAELLRLHRALRHEEPGLHREEMESRARELLDEGVRPCIPTLVNSIGMTFALLQAGTFVMGLPTEDQDDAIRARSREEWERRMGPLHEVELTRSIYVSVCQVTVGDFRTFVDSTGYRTEAEQWAGAHRWAGSDDNWQLDAATNWLNPGFAQMNRYPVTCVTWNDAQAFLQWLSEVPEEEDAGRRYRLPTEAEWEFACRGGVSTSTPYHCGRSLCSTQANFDGNYPAGGASRGPCRDQTSLVGLYVPNLLGLYDMHGNVYEWCNDWFEQDYYRYSPYQNPAGPDSGTSRVIRGGGWYCGGLYCRTTYRNHCEPGGRNNGLGFRAVLLPDSRPGF